MARGDALDRPEPLGDLDLNRLFLGGVAAATPLFDARDAIMGDHESGQGHRHQGTQLGGETPLICTPLVGRTRERVLAEAATVVAKKPDVIEWRVDYFEAIGDTTAVLDTAKALRAAVGDTPIIFTRRSIKEGRRADRARRRGVVRLYDAVGASGLVDFLDFEMGNEPRARAPRASTSARKHGVRVILSYHNFAYTPGAGFPRPALSRSRATGCRCREGRGDAARRGWTCSTLLAATAHADAKARIPLISMSMGPLGAVTRMIGGVFGSSLSFAVGAASSAPGQIPIADLAVVYDVIRRSLGRG